MAEPYRISQVDHTDFTKRLNETRISGSLRITPEPDGQSGGFRSSSFSGCLRQIGYRLQNIPATDDKYNVNYTLQADMGTAIHARVQEQAIGSGMIARYAGWVNQLGTDHAIELPLLRCVAPEVRPTLERWKSNGHIDGILDTRQGDLAIWDIKTAKAEYFKKGYKWLDKKLQDYSVQLSSYLWAYRDTDGRRADTGYLYFISRANPEDRMLFRLPWQPERWAQDQARIEAAWAANKAGVLPDADPQRGPCKFCTHVSICPGLSQVA